MVRNRNIFPFLCAVGLALSAPVTMAEPAVEISGFFSIIGGKVLDGSLHGPMPDNEKVTCPCYIADYANFGVYDGAVSFAPRAVSVCRPQPN
jgi:hypothetical protein